LDASLAHTLGAEKIAFCTSSAPEKSVASHLASVKMESAMSAPRNFASPSQA